MYPAPFTYQRPSSLSEAVEMLSAAGGDAKVLAGGHSLLPVMKMRLASPKALIDIGRLSELKGIRVEGDRLVVGALTTWRELETSPLVARYAPLLAEVAGEVGDIQVRNRGTVGGSLAHADPAADLPAAAHALEATLKLVGPNGSRELGIGDFVLGPLVTALEPDEIVQEVSFAVAEGRSGSCYEKFPHPASGYAVVGVACTVRLGADGRCEQVRIGITGAGSVAYRARAVEEALEGCQPDSQAVAAAAARAAEGADLMGDRFASQEYRAHLCRVLTERAVRSAVARAKGV